VQEAVPREAARRCKAAVAHETAFAVHDVGVAVYYGGHSAGCGGYAGEHVGAVEHVAGVEEHDVVARGHGKGLVHCVVDSLVGFAYGIHLVYHSGAAVVFLVMLEKGERAVVRVAVDD